MITTITITAIIESLATAYGKNGLPWFFRIEYSRRYCSFSCWFTRPLRQISASRISGSSSALIHGGAEIPSLVIRYRWAPISAAISPGISIMWIA